MFTEAVCWVFQTGHLLVVLAQNRAQRVAERTLVG